MLGIDKIRAGRRNIAVKAIGILLIVFLGWIAGMISFVDYYGFGVLTVLTFYAFHQRRWWDYLAQVLILYFINVELLGGYYFEVHIFGMTLEVVQQGLALLSLPIIWLYNGEQGYHKKWWQYFCYSFYPLHMTVLSFRMPQILPILFCQCLLVSRPLFLQDGLRGEVQGGADDLFQLPQTACSLDFLFRDRPLVILRFHVPKTHSIPVFFPQPVSDGKPFRVKITGIIKPAIRVRQQIQQLPGRFL